VNTNAILGELERERRSRRWRKENPVTPLESPLGEMATGFTPVIGDLQDAAMAGQAAQQGRWGDAALYGAAMALPFVAGPVVKRGVDYLGRKMGAVGDVPYSQDALMELEAMRASPGAGQLDALVGVKRHPPYWHGSRGGAENIDAAIERGFRVGRSAELQLPGTSISEDPLVSYRLFTDTYTGGASRGDLDAMARVYPQVPPSQVYNLTPEMYHGGKVPPDPQAVYKKPNLYWNEAETFARRGQSPELASHTKSLEETIKREKEILESETFEAAKMRQDWVERFRREYPEKAADLGPDNLAVKQITYLAETGQLPETFVEGMEEGLARIERNVRRARVLDEHEKTLRELRKTADEPAALSARRLTPEEQALVLKQDDALVRLGAKETNLRFPHLRQGDKSTNKAVGDVVDALSGVRGNRAMFNREMKKYLDPTHALWRQLGEKAETASVEELGKLRKLSTLRRQAAEALTLAKRDKTSDAHRAYFRAQDDLWKALQTQFGTGRKPPVKPSIPAQKPPRGSRAYLEQPSWMGPLHEPWERELFLGE
jgi:hypothetical protein